MSLTGHGPRTPPPRSPPPRCCAGGGAGGCPARKGADVGQVSLWRPGDRETPEPMGKLDTVTVNGPEGEVVD
jgi:hypothetical protein